VAARLGWNKYSAAGAGLNVLTAERLTDMGGGPTFYSTLVEVRRVEKSHFQRDETPSQLAKDGAAPI